MAPSVQTVSHEPVAARLGPSATRLYAGGMTADKDESTMSQPWPCYPVKPPPRGEDLPYDDGVPLESEMHVKQLGFLIESLTFGWWERYDFYVGGNMFVYYSELQSKKNDFRGPDVFVVLNTTRKVRRSWVVWEEGGRTPDVVIELTSPSTEAVDRGEKKTIYAKVLRVPEYYLYDPIEHHLEGYSLDPGLGDYVPMTPDHRGWYRSKVLGLWLAILPGEFHGVKEQWLRWVDDDGRVFPSGREMFEVEHAVSQQAQAEAQHAQAEAQHAQAEALHAQAEALHAQAEAQQALDKAQQAEAEARRARGRLVEAGRAMIASGMSPAQVASMLGIDPGELA